MARAADDSPYDDDYGPCQETYVTLRIYPGTMHPDDVTAALGVSPSEIQVQGPTAAGAGKPRPRPHGWFLSSRGAVSSRDCRRHIDWLMDHIEPAFEKLAQLVADGARADICCFWVSAWGHSGPTLSQRQLRRLSESGLDLWFDVYRGDRDDSTPGSSTR